MLFVASLLMSQYSTAQSTIDVVASGGSFSPANITISVGDTVVWTNTSGSHNVNATTQTYPNNPESFGNAVAAGWTFSHVFTIAGNYDYQCDLHVGAGMVGTVAVAGVADIAQQSQDSDAAISKIYPSPASGFVTIELSEEILSTNSKVSLVVYNIVGKEVYRINNITSSLLNIDTAGWSKAMYSFHLLKDSQPIDTGKIIVQ